jgi:hypothetical protein
MAKGRKLEKGGGLEAQKQNVVSLKQTMKSKILIHYNQALGSKMLLHHNQDLWSKMLLYQN